MNDAILHRVLDANYMLVLFPRKRREFPPHPKIPLLVALQKGAFTEFYKMLEDTKASIFPFAGLLKALNVTKASQCPSSVIAGAQRSSRFACSQNRSEEDGGCSGETMRLFPRMKEECEKSLPKIDRFQC